MWPIVAGAAAVILVPPVLGHIASVSARRRRIRNLYGTAIRALGLPWAPPLQFAPIRSIGAYFHNGPIVLNDVWLDSRDNGDILYVVAHELGHFIEGNPPTGSRWLHHAEELFADRIAAEVTKAAGYSFEDVVDLVELLHGCEQCSHPPAWRRVEVVRRVYRRWW